MHVSGRVCVSLYRCYELNFMLQSSCGYDGMHIGNESRMNLVELKKK